jgi:hypothetical protein
MLAFLGLAVFPLSSEPIVQFHLLLIEPIAVVWNQNRVYVGDVTFSYYSFYFPSVRLLYRQAH